jgi:hypothetical protein
MLLLIVVESSPIWACEPWSRSASTKWTIPILLWRSIFEISFSVALKRLGLWYSKVELECRKSRQKAAHDQSVLSCMEPTRYSKKRCQQTYVFRKPKHQSMGRYIIQGENVEQSSHPLKNRRYLRPSLVYTGSLAGVIRWASWDCAWR